MFYVPVVDSNQVPLMPCSEKRARKMIEKGKALNLTKDRYVISKETVALVIEALSAHWFSWEGEEEKNNEDIIAADKALVAEIKLQDEVFGKDAIKEFI